MAIAREVILTLSDVEKALREFEREYGVSSLEFLRNAELRSQIPEDDAFMWEAYIDHRRELRRLHEEVHQKYLTTLGRGTQQQPATPSPADDLVSLAA